MRVEYYSWGLQSRCVYASVRSRSRRLFNITAHDSHTHGNAVLGTTHITAHNFASHDIASDRATANRGADNHFTYTRAYNCPYARTHATPNDGGSNKFSNNPVTDNRANDSLADKHRSHQPTDDALSIERCTDVIPDGYATARHIRVHREQSVWWW